VLRRESRESRGPHRVGAHKQRVPGGAGARVGAACSLPLHFEPALNLRACVVSALTSHKRPEAYCSSLGSCAERGRTATCRT
jgi:hypothetical protein